MANRKPVITVREDFGSGLATMFVDGKPRASLAFREIMDKAKWDFELSDEQLLKIENDYKDDLIERGSA